LADLDDVLFVGVEVPREELRSGGDAEASKPFLLALEIVEELAARVRRADADEAPVIEEVLEEVGADPVPRVRGEGDAAVGSYFLIPWRSPMFPSWIRSSMFRYERR